MSGDKLTVTQEAREAVAKQVEAAFYDECEYAQEMRQGLHDSDPNLQHFARFEAETTARATTELVEALRLALRIIDEIDAYQKSPQRGDYGVECACCMGELLDDDRDDIAAARKALTLHDRALGK